MDICKEAEVNTVGQVSGEDLEQINTLTRRALKAEEVYTFAVRLCDNEIDRDMERFDEDTLEELGKPDRRRPTLLLSEGLGLHDAHRGERDPHCRN